MPEHDVPKRRAHRKSRTGCKNCKLRRTKCDEVKPACTSCLRFNITCSYLGDGDQTTSKEEAALTTNRINSARPRGRGRPRKDWQNISAASPAASQTNSNVVPIQSPLSSRPSPYNVYESDSE